MNPEPAQEDTEATVPPDFRKALAGVPVAKAKWGDLTPISRRDFISWLDSAKQAETRRRRIEKACSMLAAGKRRPCCYSIVSFDLYSALKATPLAKAQWSDLTAGRTEGIHWLDGRRQRTAGTSTSDRASLRDAGSWAATAQSLIPC